MAQKKLFRGISIAAVTLGLFVLAFGCKKKNETTTEDTSYATDHIQAEKTFNDVEAISDQANNNVTAGTGMGYRGTSETIGACASVSHTGDSIIVDFGSTNCSCLDGRTRRGRIIVTYTGGSYATVGSSHTISFDNYYVDDNHVEGHKTVTNVGDSAGHLTFHVTIDGTITRTTGTVVHAVWNRERWWYQGDTTRTGTDDAYMVSGTGTVTRTPSGGSATTCTVTIPTTAPLVMAYGCRYVEAGTINYVLSTGATRSINFGTTPVCNNTATVTWTTASGATGSRDITLP